MFKKIISSILAVAMLSSIGTTVFANDGGDLDDIMLGIDTIIASDFERDIANKVISEYSTDEQFLLHIEDDKEDAINMLKVVIKSEIKKSKLRGNWYDGQYDVNVPNIVQRTYTSCGAASALQAISSKGWEENVPGSRTDEKQIQLEKDTGIYGTSNGAVVGSITKSINKYINPDGTWMDATYVHRAMTNASKETFKQYIVESMLCGGAPILHAIPKYLTSYYPSSSTTGHYIAVKSIDTYNNTMTVSDCNWRGEYNGEFTITIDEAYNSVHSTAGRYLMYIPYA